MAVGKHERVAVLCRRLAIENGPVVSGMRQRSWSGIHLTLCRKENVLRTISVDGIGIAAAGNWKNSLLGVMNGQSPQRDQLGFGRIL